MNGTGQLVFLNQLSQAVFPPNVPQWSDIESVVDKWVEKALYGQATPEQAVQAADKEITTILQGRR